MRRLDIEATVREAVCRHLGRDAEIEVVVPNGRGIKVTDTLLTDSRFYITTQKTDHLHWLLDTIGDDNLVVGTDYGHNDVAVEIEIIQRMGSDGSLSASSAQKILESNPSKLYAIN